MAHSADDATQKISEERWRRIDELLREALEREPKKRAAFLKNACSGQDELRAEIESLLAYVGQEHPLLESVAWPAARLLSTRGITRRARVPGRTPAAASSGDLIAEGARRERGRAAVRG